MFCHLIFALVFVREKKRKMLKNFETDLKSNRPYGAIKTLIIYGKIKESYTAYIVANFKVSVLGEN